MKLLKILAMIMTVCLLATALIACDNGGSNDETTVADTTPETKVEVTLIVKDGSTTMYEGSVTCNGQLGDAIELFAIDQEFEGECFDDNGLLSTIGELKADDTKSWKAYYEDQGESKAFSSIRDQELTNGKTVVIVLEAD